MTEGSRETYGAMSPDEQAPAPSDAIEADDEHTALRAALVGLSELERHVVQARASGEPIRDLARQLGLPSERVRELETRALCRLRRAFGEAA